MSSYIKIKETKDIAEQYGLTVKYIFQGDRNTYAYITFSDGKHDFKFDRGSAGEWLSAEFSKDEQWGYMAAGNNGGMNVHIEYHHLLDSDSPCHAFEDVRAMANEIVYQYDLDIPVRVIDVTGEGGGDHEYRVINFHALGEDRTELLDENSDICTRDTSDLYDDRSLNSRDVKNIRQQLIDWLETNSQPDLTEEATPVPAT